MNKMSGRRKYSTLLVMYLFWALPLISWANEATVSPTSIVENNRSAIVTLQYLVTTKMTMKTPTRPAMDIRDDEQASEITCVMVSAKGLLLCSNSQLTGFAALISRMVKGSGANISSEPSAFKVLVEGEPAPFDAEVVARDSDLDLVWLQVSNAGEKSFAHIAFAATPEPGLGDKIWVLRRLSDHFGRPLVVSGSMISGVTDIPRKLYIPEVTGMVAAGVPAFSASGEAIGLLVMQVPEADQDSASPVSMMGMSNKMQDAMSGVILPSAAVSQATAGALELQDRAAP